MTKIPRKRQTHLELCELQRMAARMIMRPLTSDFKMQRQWIDDRPTKDVVETFIKPNDRLSSFERIEIYNKQYWFRLIDCLYDDNPGMLAVLGKGKFNHLIISYLEHYPSRSYTMRNLGSRLVKFIQEHPDLVSPRFDLALDMAKLEWAQVLAFDEREDTIVTVDDLLGKKPDKLRLALQPHITMLHMGYPLDEYVLQLKQDNLRGEASNASAEDRPEASARRRVPLPRRRETFVVVHRYKYSIYYKRLDRAGFQVLSALAAGKSVVAALSQKFDEPPDAQMIKEWFETWTSLGWFCRR